MDISSIFQSCVNSVLACNKVIEDPMNKNHTLKLLQKKTVFTTKAYLVTQKISILYKLLLDNREAYLNFYNYLPNKDCITNNDRDDIDSVAQNIIGLCSKLINELKKEILESNVSQQHQEHNEIIILLVQNYLKHICKIYSEQKAIRIKKNIEVKKISKLEPVLKKKKTFIGNNEFIVNITNNLKINKCMNKAKSLKIQEINGDITGIPCYEDEQLSTEDIQVFETENEQLYNELNILSEELKQIENRVVQITELQNIFTEKILDQDKNLERVLITVVGSTENVREANEQIRKAIQRNAGLRVWILFFLLVMSFTLIFLDWYNP